MLFLCCRVLNMLRVCVIASNAAAVSAVVLRLLRGMLEVPCMQMLLIFHCAAAVCVVHVCFSKC